MKHLKAIFILIIVVMSLFSCRRSFHAEKPKESYLPTNSQPALSQFPIHIDVDILKLQDAVNKKLNGLLYEGDKIDGQDLSVKIWKLQDFQFSVKGNEIEYRVPLKVWSRFAWRIHKFGFNLSDHYEANGSIALSFKTTINIGKDWKLKATTVSTGYEWIKEPKLNIFGITVPVTPIANITLSQCNQLITEKIDQSIDRAVDLRKYISTVWDLVQKPIKVNEQNNIWLRVTPKDIYVSPFSTTNQNQLDLTVSLYAGIESFMGYQPTQNQLIPLPEYRSVQHPAKQFNFNLSSDITFDKINELAQKQLAGKIFSEGSNKIIIDDLSIYGSSGKAVFEATVSGSLNGKIYFTGDLVYNSDKMTVSLDHPEFDIMTQNALLKSANWLLHSLILKKIAPYLTYSVKDNLVNLKDEANKIFENYTIADGVAIKGKLDTINVTGLYLIPGAVRINANLKGDINILVSGIRF